AACDDVSRNRLLLGVRAPTHGTPGNNPALPRSRRGYRPRPAPTEWVGDPSQPLEEHAIAPAAITRSPARCTRAASSSRSRPSANAFGAVFTRPMALRIE